MIGAAAHLQRRLRHLLSGRSLLAKEEKDYEEDKSLR
jgi:hypothetical protein